MEQGAPPVGGTTLAREAIGLREVFFQSVTHMAPGAAVAFSIGELARHLPSAGGMYTYVARGIHPGAGFLVAWGYALVEPLVAPLLFLIFGVVVAGTLDTEFNCFVCHDHQWWIWALVASVLVLALGYFGIRLSAGTGTV